MYSYSCGIGWMKNYDFSKKKLRIAFDRKVLSIKINLGFSKKIGLNFFAVEKLTQNK